MYHPFAVYLIHKEKKAKALVLRTRRGPEDLDFEQRSSASDEDRNSVRSPRASLTSITKAKKLLRLQARKHHKVNRLPRGHLADNTTHSAEATPSQSEADVTDTPSAYEDLD